MSSFEQNILFSLKLNLEVSSKEIEESKKTLLFISSLGETTYIVLFG